MEKRSSIVEVERKTASVCGMAEKKVVDGKDLIAFLCKLNSILIASTTMKTVVCYSGKVSHRKENGKEENFALLFHFSPCFSTLKDNEQRKRLSVHSFLFTFRLFVDFG